MKNSRPYIVLYILLLLLQTLFFESLTFSAHLSPLIYTLFLLLLPMQNSQLTMLLISLGVGVSADLVMGLAGVNTIVAMLMGYVRISILDFAIGEKLIAQGGAPLYDVVGKGRFFKYSAIFIMLYHIIFFVVESLAIEMWLLLLLDTVVSSAVVIIFGWVISRLFESMLRRG